MKIWNVRVAINSFFLFAWLYSVSTKVQNTNQISPDKHRNVTVQTKTHQCIFMYNVNLAMFCVALVYLTKLQERQDIWQYRWVEDQSDICLWNYKQFDSCLVQRIIQNNQFGWDFSSEMCIEIEGQKIKK